MTSDNVILQPFKLNELLTLKNRVVMAPMTRCKADNFKATAAMADYYARRATAGLIITEGTVISDKARGHDGVPGIFNSEQIDAWRKVINKVHANNGLIFQQIWHVGRVSHPYFLNGELPVSASATFMSGHIPRSNDLQFGSSRELSKDEIKDLISQYAVAAANAMKAGFDGIEIHGANGYLVDQFLHSDTNRRQDEYGGSPENMARFALEVVKACGEAIGYERVGLRLSPGAHLNQIKGNEKDADIFAYLLRELNHLNIAYIHTGNFDDSVVYSELNNQSMTTFMRKHYQGVLIACGSYIIESAEKSIETKEFDLVAIGRQFIANPDLIVKAKNKEPLINYDPAMLAELV